MWQFHGAFHGEGETGAKGVILGLLWASNRRIKMVGYREALHFCLFFCPCLISCKFELLSRPFKLTTLVPHYVFGPRAVIRVFCALYAQRWSLQLAVIAQVGHRSWLKECDGYNSHSDAEKELNSFISSAKGLGRDWCKCRQDGCN